MSISQNIYDYIELSKITKQPILLISNPGYGKTTSITNWAKEKGYHYEQLIGSRFSPDDIMGYQVNEPGSPTLVQKDPIWFQRIMDASKDNKPSLLFCDEISTCSEQVQGSLLSLIFDRRIGNGKCLPEDCIIIAAANYSENLPSFMNIMAPTINRFCIVNLLWGYNNSEIIHECLVHQTPKTRAASDVDEDEIEKQYNEMINDLIVKYSHVDGSLGYIDLQNHDISNIYKRKGNVYNILSWRSITYLKEFVKALAKLGIDDPIVIKNVCAGMIGLGSNNFKTEDQVEAFINLVADHVKQIVEANVNDGMDTAIDPNAKLSDIINEYVARLESSNTLGSTKYENALIDKISQKYGDWTETYRRLEKAVEAAKKSGNKVVPEATEFINDMDSIALLINKVSQQNAETIADIHQSCSGMYNNLLGTDNKFSKEIYGTLAPQVIKSVILGKDKNGDVCRVGVFGEGKKSYVVIPSSTKVFKATLSRLIREDNFTKLELGKIL